MWPIVLNAQLTSPPVCSKIYFGTSTRLNSGRRCAPLEQRVLPYQLVCPQIKDGDIALFRPEWSLQHPLALLGLLIAHGTDGPYSHAGMLSVSPWGKHRIWLLETLQFQGGKASKFADEVRGYPGQWDIHRPWPPYDGEAAVAEMAKIIDQPYGWSNLAYVALTHTRLLSKLLPPATDDKLNGSAPFCSQAVSWASRRGGGRDPRPNHADIVTEPGHLAAPTFAGYLFTCDWEKAT